MRLSTRIALAVGATVPVLVLATGWLLLRLVATDLHHQQDAHLRESAAAVAKDARGLLRASAADRSAAVEQARERRLFTSALDVGVRLVGPGETFTGGPQPEQGVPLPVSAPVPVTLRAAGTPGGCCRRGCPVRGPEYAARSGCSRPTPPRTPNCGWCAGAW